MDNQLQTLLKTFEEFLGVENEQEEIQPFDPEQISIDKKPVTMDTILRRLEQGTIILSPDFQRNEVWDQEKKSQLIESLMLKIPIPMFYVSADEKGNFTVVDGLQRLSTIRSYILGDDFLRTKNEKQKGKGFELSGLEFWGNKYEGKIFNDLPVHIQNRVLETEFTFTIINPGTPEEVKRNVFKRINTGGEPLTPQEIRHALYGGIATKLLVKLALSEEFAYATEGSVKPLRMLDRELILRFLSFTVRNYSKYPKNNDMDAFLSNTMRIINSFPHLMNKDILALLPDESDRSEILIRDTQTLENLFNTAMLRAKNLFNDHTFRRSIGDKKKTPINKSLFEVWSVELSRLSESEYNCLQENKTSFLEEYSRLLENDQFIDSISKNSWKFSGVMIRFTLVSTLLKSYIC